MASAMVNPDEQLSNKRGNYNTAQFVNSFKGSFTIRGMFTNYVPGSLGWAGGGESLDLLTKPDPGHTYLCIQVNLSTIVTGELGY